MYSAAPLRLDGETALITGGGTGIGFGIARCMVWSGARVVLVGRRGQELAQTCAELGPRAWAVPHDITRFSAADGLIAVAEEKVGSPISSLVDNGGIHLKRAALDTTPEEFQSVLDTHVIAAHALTQAVLPGTLHRSHRSILFTSSMAAYMGAPSVVAYSAAKSAYFGIVASLSAELAPKGLRVNAIAPGWILSDMTQRALDQDPVRKNRVFSRIQMGRMGTPEDIGWAAVYHASPAAAYVTGITLPIDGGATAGF